MAKWKKVIWRSRDICAYIERTIKVTGPGSFPGWSMRKLLWSSLRLTWLLFSVSNSHSYFPGTPTRWRMLLWKNGSVIANRCGKLPIKDWNKNEEALWGSVPQWSTAIWPGRGLQGMRDSKKLSPRYVGPYRIIQQINPVTYRLDLVIHASIHHFMFLDWCRSFQVL